MVTPTKSAVSLRIYSLDLDIFLGQSLKSFIELEI